MTATTTKAATSETADPDLLSIERKGAWSLGLVLLAGIVVSAFRGQWRSCAAFLAGEVILAGTVTVPDPESIPGRRRGSR